ncbi:MAG: hypothetical protein CMB53_02375 [Euryarchaeota archaeon]|nr:hypothetical protein [Euryarchaeota archaeon]|tara:strand:+ start:322 stop:1050 length:729 start_codon:yes stop_codon:yes gene_type:complete
MDFPQSEEEVISLLSDFAVDTYPTLMAILSIAAYSSFVFMFYRILAKRDLITLDLSKYANDFKGKVQRYVRSLLFLLQYIVLIPLLISFWTLVLATILTLLSDGTDHSRNALIATSVVGAVRILSYWTEDLSRDVAKMLPFAVLGVFLVDSTSVQWSQFEDLLGNLPGLAESFYTSLVLLVILETLLRISHSIGNRLYPIPDLEATFKQADADGDGKLTLGELAAAQASGDASETPIDSQEE